MGAKIVLQMVRGVCALLVIYHVVLLINGGDLKDWSVKAMTIEEVREIFMTVVYDELSDDSDNCRANRIIDAADEYVEEIMRLERDKDGKD